MQHLESQMLIAAQSIGFRQCHSMFVTVSYMYNFHYVYFATLTLDTMQDFKLKYKWLSDSLLQLQWNEIF